MAEPSLQLGNGNWAGKSSNLLAYHKVDTNFYADELTFTRASTGTIVNSDGLIEQVPYNLLTYSEELDNTWTPTNTTVTSGQSGYDGSNNAWLVDVSVDGGNLRKDTSEVGINNFSIYAKKGTANGIRIRFDQDSDVNVYIDLTDGSVFISANTLSLNVNSEGSGWYRIEFSFEAVGLNLFRLITTDGTTTQSAGSIYLQSPQLVSGSTAKPYFPTTTRLNVPRIDYLNNAKGSLLLEPQRTNLVTYSQDFSNAAWSKSGASVVSGFTSPDGTTNAFKLVEDASTGSHRLGSINYNSTSGQDNTVSCFVKKGESSYFQIIFSGASHSSANYANFDIDNGVLGNSSTGVSSIEDFGDGWYRCIFTSTAINTGSSGQFFLFKITSPTSARAQSYTGNGTDGLYIYGAGIELDSYATSYIPSSGTSVTRIADSANSLDNSLSGGKVGTFFVELVKLENSVDASGSAISIRDNSGGEEIRLHFDTPANTVRFRDANNGFANIGGAFTVTNNTAFKMAFSSNGTTIAAFGNGSQIGGDYTIVNPIAFDKITINGLMFEISQLLYYPTALTNSELQTLTTL
jgi:hypothetical protein